MSRADEHARDLAEFVFFEDATTEFTGLLNVQEVLNSITTKNNGNHTGTTNLQTVEIANGLRLLDGFLLIEEDATLRVMGETILNGALTSFDKSDLSDVDINGTVNTFGDVDFNNSVLDFSSATVVGFPTNTATLPNWSQAYRYPSSPSTASRSVTITRSLLEGKELIIVVYDPNSVDEMSVVHTYFPVIRSNMPLDHVINLGTIWDDSGTSRVEYRSGAMDANESRILLVLARDPVVFPVGGITFDATTAITWSNT